MTETKSGTDKRTRNDPRKQATQNAIIETAESLFAEFGIEGVSLRQIGAASGSANTGVVAYHFGNKETLLEAIFHYRLPAIDQRRGELWAETGEQNTDVYGLLRAMWLPLYEQTNAKGQHSYAGFMGALMRSQWGGMRTLVNDAYPQTNLLGDQLKAALPPELQALFAARMTMSAVMITGALQLMDLGLTRKPPVPTSTEAFFNDTLHMATAALLSPAGED